ncbi:MAG: 3-dehydroquinate synthase [Frankiaceae bacterium]|nr:3-dehydroquinate synthase [Frankiaceae bacterium]
MKSTTVSVAGERPYDVIIGRDVTELLPGLLQPARQVALIHAKPMAQWADTVGGALRSAGFLVHLIEVPDAEEAKTLAVASQCFGALGEAGFTRTDAVVGLGGGAVTDLAGFVAATWLRGVPVVHLPTTLLGMVDAAVGGKTGVNTDHGKNLVGAFHPPTAVLCDLAALDTLPVRDFASGLAEVVKAGFIADPVILDIIEADPREAAQPGGPRTLELVERAVKVKADIVSRDLREAGPREALNYGHTLGHAIERAEAYRWRHGDAVSVGLCYAAELGRLTGQLDDDTAARHSAVLASLGLPTTYRADAWPELLAAMRNDKKSRGDRLRFVVLEGPGQPVIVEAPDDNLLAEAYRAVSD